MLEGIAAEARENGRVIFDMSVLDKVASQAPQQVVNRAVEKRLREKLAEATGKPLEDLDLFLLMEQPEPALMIESAAFEFVLSPETPIDVKRATLYDRFIIEYPDSANRRALLGQVRGLSQVFVHFVPDEVARRRVATQESSRTSIPDVLGRVTKDNREAQAVVREDLQNVGVPDAEILATPDPERIIFLQERQAFPIRFIESVKALKKCYDAFPDKAALHIDKRDVPNMFELLLL